MGFYHSIADSVKTISIHTYFLIMQFNKENMRTGDPVVQAIAALQRHIPIVQDLDDEIADMELGLLNDIPGYGQGSQWDASALLQRLSGLLSYIKAGFQEQLVALLVHHNNHICRKDPRVTMRDRQNNLYGLWRHISLIQRGVTEVDSGDVRIVIHDAAVALREYAKGEHYNTLPFPPYSGVGGDHDSEEEMTDLAEHAFYIADVIAEYPEEVKVDDASENSTEIQDIHRLIWSVYGEMADRAASHANAIRVNALRTDIPQCELVKIAQSRIELIKSIESRAADIWPLFLLMTRLKYFV